MQWDNWNLPASNAYSQGLGADMMNGTGLGVAQGSGGFFGPQAGLTDQIQSRGVLGGMAGWASNAFDNATSEGGLLTSKSMFGGEGSSGWFGPAMQGLGALAQGWTGMQQLDLARENLAFQKEAFNKNYQNQVALTNQAMVDRQTKRSNASSSWDKPDEQWKKDNLLPTK